MHCKKCGKEISDGSKVCEFCGATVAVDEQMSVPIKQPIQQRFSKNIVLCDDGIYRWSYGMNMWKNPTILITAWKVLFLGGMLPVLLVTILELFEQGFADAVEVFVPMFFGMIGIVTALLIIAYPIVALLNGGAYQVVFEMDNKGVRHIQLEKQFKKNQVMAMITVLAGAAAGSPGTVGAGLLAGSKKSSYSEFKSVKKIIAKPKRHVIYVNESLEHNQVYANKEDFEQVKTYIIEHCKNATLS